MHTQISSVRVKWERSQEFVACMQCYKHDLLLFDRAAYPKAHEKLNF